MIFIPSAPPPQSTQDAYDRIRAYFTEPGADLARDDHGKVACEYRAANGRACAVGCLIPDNLYNPEIERRTADAVTSHPETEAEREIAYFLAAADADFLCSAQYLHDKQSVSAEEFVFGLDSLALEYDLFVPSESSSPS